MIQEKNYFIKCVHHRAAVGGFFCPCCAPRGGKARREFLRAAKRAFNQQMKKEMQQDLE